MLEGISTIIFDLGGTLKIDGVGDWIWHHDYLEIKRLAKNYKIVIAANQPARARFFIKESEIGPCVSDIYLSKVIGLKKPNPKFFQYVLDDLKLKPQEVVYVGNDLINDVRTPQKLGIKTIFVKRPIKLIFIKNLFGKLLGIKADYTVSSIKEIE
jgi:putative hydrolase of the HAD superfamily